MKKFKCTYFNLQHMLMTAFTDVITDVICIYLLHFILVEYIYIFFLVGRYLYLTYFYIIIHMFDIFIHGNYFLKHFRI